MLRRSFAALKVPGKLCTWSDGFYTKLGHSPGGKTFRPQVISGLSVLDVFPGFRHTLVLSSSQSLFSFGDNDYGQLGLGERKDTEAPQEVVECPNNIVSAACGVNYSLAVTQEGDIVEWGQPGKGQGIVSKLFLRRPSNSLRNPFPRLLSSLSDEQVVSVAAGELHYLVLTQSGGVYAWGNNEFGSCGTGSVLSDYKAPRRLDFFDRLPMGDVVSALFACGNSSAALTRAGHVYMWGGNEKGQLALNSETEEANTPMQATPHLVQALQSTPVLDVSLGLRTSSFLCADGNVYVAGAGQWTFPFKVTLPGDFQPASVASSEDFFAFVGKDGSVVSLGGPFPGSENRPQEIPEEVKRVDEALFPGKVVKLVAPYNYCAAIIAEL